MFTLAHLSDPHVSPLPRPSVMELASKRVTGFLSWTLRRNAIHGGPVLGILAADLRNTAPDHIVVTGDIINISLPGEYVQAAAWLHRLGRPERVTVIPGNHDIYVPIDWDRSIGLWADFMTGSPPGDAARESPARSDADFPFVRIRGPVAIIGVSTACPMPPFSAAGRVGRDQLAALRTRLIELGKDRLFRVVLIHHPPFDTRGHWRKRLVDSAEFRAVIAEAGAELVLHGHTHRSGLTKLPTPNGAAPVIGVPSASAKFDHHGRGHGQYHLYRVGRAGDDWRLDVEVRGVVPSLERFVREGQFSLTIPQ
jgi:3',5'-cyclic AMP phosphodiesterase CpdA